MSSRPFFRFSNPTWLGVQFEIEQMWAFGFKSPTALKLHVQACNRTQLHSPQARAAVPHTHFSIGAASVSAPSYLLGLASGEEASPIQSECLSATPQAFVRMDLMHASNST